jgi:protein O-mannosyl-transferase
MTRKLLICPLLVLGTVTVYAPVWHYRFVNYDDYDYIRDNPFVVGGFTHHNVLSAFTKFYSHNWHPLTWLSHMLDVELWGLNAGGHHLTNVILHSANAVLLFLILTSMTSALWRSALVAAVFAWHPLHVESVAWISERKDVLSTFFWILTIAAYLHYARQPRVRRYLLVFVCFAMALMCKPMTVTLPFVLLLLDFWPLNRARLTRNDARAWLNLFLEKVPLLGLAFISSLITIEAQHRSGAIQSLLELPLQLRLSNAPVSYINYLCKSVLPFKLSVFYPLASAIPLWQAAGAAAFLLALSALAFAAAKRHPYLIVGWLWFVGTLVPVIGLVQVGYQSMADRYTYVPLIGVTIAGVWGTWELLKRTNRAQSLAATLSAALLLFLLQAAIWQVRYWRDNFTLFQRALSVTSNNWLAHNNLSNALLEQRRDLEAASHALAAVQIRLNYPDARLNLGVALLRQGKTSEAILHLNQALELQPNWPEAEQYFGFAMMDAGRVDEAIQHFYKALRLNPNLVPALKRLAWIRATQPDAKRRDASEALTLATRAAKITSYKDADALDVFAAALAEAGRFDEAIRTGEQARNLALRANQTELARKIAYQLDLYRLGLPYRGRQLPNLFW